MTVSYIIAEYNPFHSGHAFHIRKTIEATGCDITAVILSGSIVQRSDVACFSKHSRAEAAVREGADIVIELPFPFSAASAKGFAQAGAYTAAALGGGYLSFGSECGDIDLLIKAADAVIKSDSDIPLYLKDGISYAAAREKAARMYFGTDQPDIFRLPNNALAIEYIIACKRFGGLTPVTVKRNGGGHDSPDGSSYIRELLFSGTVDVQSILPHTAGRIFSRQLSSGLAPATLKRIERSVLYKLSGMSTAEMSSISEISGGLENKIPQAAAQSSTLEQLYDACKSKNYSMSRIRRAALFAFCNIEKSYNTLLPQYARLLAFNDRGTAFLKNIKPSIPVITKPADGYAVLSPDGKSIFTAEQRATELFGRCTPSGICTQDITSSPVFVKED